MNSFKIFDTCYTNKVYILGSAFLNRAVVGTINYIENIYFLKSHGKKYELSLSGLKDSSVHNNKLKINLKEVEEYKIPEKFTYYACDGIKEGEIEIFSINSTVNSIKNEDINFDILYLKSKLYNFDLFDKIISNEVFSIVINDECENFFIGDVVNNNKKFTRCSLNELKEILDLKPIINKEIDINR